MTDEPRRIEHGSLTIQSEPHNAHFVSLHGELDGATAKELEAEFIRIEATSVSRIVLDLRELEFHRLDGTRRDFESRHTSEERRPRPPRAAAGRAGPPSL